MCDIPAVADLDVQPRFWALSGVPYLAVSYFYHHISSLVIIYQSIYGVHANTHSEVGHPVRNHTIPYPCGFKQGLVNFIEPDNQTGSLATVEIQLKMDLVSCLSNFNSKYTCTNAIIWAAANELPNHNVHQNPKLLNCASLFLGLELRIQNGIPMVPQVWKRLGTNPSDFWLTLGVKMVDLLNGHLVGKMMNHQFWEYKMYN